jgi:hypothetical protein
MAQFSHPCQRPLLVVTGGSRQADRLPDLVTMTMVDFRFFIVTGHRHPRIPFTEKTLQRMVTMGDDKSHIHA